MKKSKTSKVKKSFVLIRATGDEAKLIEKLKQQTHQATGTGALLQAGRQYLALYDHVAALQQENEKLKDDLRSNSNKIQNFISALNAFLPNPPGKKSSGS